MDLSHFVNILLGHHYTLWFATTKRPVLVIGYQACHILHTCDLVEIMEVMHAFLASIFFVPTYARLLSTWECTWFNIPQAFDYLSWRNRLRGEWEYSILSGYLRDFECLLEQTLEFLISWGGRKYKLVICVGVTKFWTIFSTWVFPWWALSMLFIIIRQEDKMENGDVPPSKPGNDRDWRDVWKLS